MMITPRLAAGVVGGALLGPILGVVSPAMASAALDAPAGQYQVTYGDPEVPAETWTFNPCGSDCTVANNNGDKTPHNWQFHLSNGRWTYHGQEPLDVKFCSDYPNATIGADVSFDAATLAGSWRDGPSGDCGPAFPQENLSLQLTKTG